jgi:hypothetical protein
MNECVVNKVNYRYITVTFASRLIIMFTYMIVGAFYRLHLKKSVHRENLYLMMRKFFRLLANSVKR